MKVTRFDIGLQWRSHFYTATAVMTLMVCAVAMLIPLSPLPGHVVALLLFADPAIVGISFVGGLVMMEKGANTLSALKTTPMPGWLYVSSKLISMTLLGVGCGVVVAIAATGGRLSYVVCAIALGLSNILAVLLGFCLVTRVKSVNGFLRNMILASMILMLPLFSFYHLVPAPLSWLFNLIPSYPMLVLFEGAATPASVGFSEIAIWSVYLMCWIGGAWIWALREYDRYLTSEAL